MASALFDAYPGGRQIVQIGPNPEAQAFRRRVIAPHTIGRFTERTVQGRRHPLVTQEFETAQLAGDLPARAPR